MELLDENGELLDTVEQEINLPFLLTDSVIRNNVWAFHPTLMSYEGMFNYVPLYRENVQFTIPLRFVMAEEFRPLFKKVRAKAILDEGLVKAALDTRQACHTMAFLHTDLAPSSEAIERARENGKEGEERLKALTAIAEKLKTARSAFEAAAEAGYPLAKVAVATMEASGIFAQRNNLLLEEVVDRLAPAANEGNVAAIYLTFQRLERDAANFESQKRSVPYLRKAALVNPESMIRMGEVQEQGFYGEKPDPQRAGMYYKEGIRLLRLLANQGLPGAANALGRVYLEGLGTKQDTPRAERYYKFAKEKGGYEDPEFWFWENYGVAMRQVRMPELFTQHWGNFPWGGEYFDSTVPGSSKNPRTCMYLIREKYHSPMIETAGYYHTGLVNIPTVLFCSKSDK